MTCRCLGNRVQSEYRSIQKKCSGSEAGEVLTCVRLNKEVSIGRVERVKRREKLVDEAVREVRSQIVLGFVNLCKDFDFALSEKESHWIEE